MPEQQRPLFESNALESIKRVIATFSERGQQYGDTWRNSQHLMLRAVSRRFNIAIPESALNAIASAVMVDVKTQRSEGGYKDDTLIDLIAYSAFLAEEMRQFERPVAASNVTCLHMRVARVGDTEEKICLDCRAALA